MTVLGVRACPYLQWRRLPGLRLRRPGLWPFVWLKGLRPREPNKPPLLFILLPTALVTTPPPDAHVTTLPGGVAFLVYAQRADSTFTSLHPTFDSSPTPALARAYFYDLCAALPDAPPETLLEFFAAIDAALDVAHEEILEAAEEVFVTFALDVRKELGGIEKEGAMRAAYNVLSLLRLAVAALGEMNEVVAVKGRGEFGSGLGGVLKKRREERKGEEYENAV
ncbi:hypothetical protein DFP72DRAFT_1063985 [Ephemerocybe angulata]|uniref:Uncharacterized protein n=1 Tax=Ephemerocybe angulata TaxID=980116 RepID=A0A8H6I8A0_9AGAR|nr:hypothetical protein DFP72DRAFT_1063985 [Tulosesus angulatus]